MKFMFWVSIVCVAILTFAFAIYCELFAREFLKIPSLPAYWIAKGMGFFVLLQGSILVYSLIRQREKFYKVHEDLRQN